MLFLIYFESNMSCNFQVKHFACEKVISNLLTKKAIVYEILFERKSYLKVMIKAEYIIVVQQQLFAIYIR